MSGTPWNDYGIIAYISKNVPDLGKTKLQKLIYLMKEVGKVPLVYSFRFYNYGPYSDKLAENLDYVNSLDGVKMSYEPFYNMYEIKPGESADKLIEKAMSSIEPSKPQIDFILNTYGIKTARDLELITTIIYVDKNNHQPDEKALAGMTHDLKPKFSSTEIFSEIDKLKTSGLILQ